jgi:acyl carrier protein
VSDAAAEIDARIVSALSRATRIEPARLLPEASLSELEVTSLDVVNVLFEVEEEFGVEIPSEAEEGMQTVGDVVKRLRDAVLAARSS